MFHKQTKRYLFMCPSAIFVSSADPIEKSNLTLTTPSWPSVDIIKCDPMLRAVGIPTVLHTTPHGRIKELDMRPANAALLSNENVYIPLNAACRERNIICKRLMQKCEPVIAKR
jgi:hypothetical protein